MTSKYSFICLDSAVQEPKTQLPLVALKKVWGEAVSYICGLKEDYSRLFQGQRAAMWVTWAHPESHHVFVCDIFSIAGFHGFY